MSGHGSPSYIDFDSYGCWLNPATHDVLVCGFQQHREVMAQYMKQADPASGQGVFSWAFGHGWIKIENEIDANGSQTNLQGNQESLKRAWPLLRRDLLHVDEIFVDIEDLHRHLHWNQYKDRERIRSFNLDDEAESRGDTGSFGFVPCYQL